jgi:hypothetical protein
MRSRRHSSVLAGLLALAVPLGMASAARADEPVCPAAAPEGADRLAPALCCLRQSVNPRKAAWSPAFCRTLAEGVLASARRHDLAPALLLAVMINESDLDEKAARVSHPDGGIAKDSGLMGIRCVLGPRGRCTNSFVRGMPWRTVMDPVANVELGALYLAHYRDGGGRSQVTVRLRDDDGAITTKIRNIPCPHRDHAWWAHYNHGTRYINHGEARFYPHHVAVLQDALAEGLGLERQGGPVPRYTLTALQRSDAGARRFVQLCGLIRSSTAAVMASIGAPATLTVASQNASRNAARL